MKCHEYTAAVNGQIQNQSSKLVSLVMSTMSVSVSAEES